MLYFPHSNHQILPILPLQYFLSFNISFPFSELECFLFSVCNSTNMALGVVSTVLHPTTLGRNISLDDFMNCIPSPKFVMQFMFPYNYNPPFDQKYLFIHSWLQIIKSFSCVLFPFRNLQHYSIDFHNLSLKSFKSEIYRQSGIIVIFICISFFDVMLSFL